MKFKVVSFSHRHRLYSHTYIYISKYILHIYNYIIYIYISIYIYCKQTNYKDIIYICNSFVMTYVGVK